MREVCVWVYGSRTMHALITNTVPRVVLNTNVETHVLCNENAILCKTTVVVVAAVAVRTTTIPFLHITLDYTSSIRLCRWYAHRTS